MAIRNVSTSFSVPAAEQASIDRQRRLGTMLQEQSMTPIESQNGAPISYTQGLAKMLQAYAGGQKLKGAEERERALAEDMGNKFSTGLSNYMETLRGEPEIPSPPAELGGGPARPAMPGDRQQAFAQLLSSGHPALQEFGMQSIAQEPERQLRIDEFQAARDDRLSARDQQQRQFDAQLQASREDREQQMAFQQQMAREARDAQMRMAQMSAAQSQAAMQQQLDLQREMLATKRAQYERDKQILPAPALKMQQDAIQNLQTAKSIETDLDTLKKQIESGKLPLGIVNNTEANIRNFLGVSNEQSRNLESFKANLERLRNESLRLNVGPQTDADAERAWNELIRDIDDPGVVKQRLAEISAINNRAANFYKKNIQGIRQNYGLGDIDTSAFESPQPAVGLGAGKQQLDINSLLEKYSK